MGRGLRDRSRALPILLLRRAEELLHQWGALQDRANDWQQRLTQALRGPSVPAEVERMRRQLNAAEGDVSKLWDIALEENIDMGVMVDRWIELQQRGANPRRWDPKFNIAAESLVRRQIDALKKSCLLYSSQRPRD